MTTAIHPDFMESLLLCMVDLRNSNVLHSIKFFSTVQYFPPPPGRTKAEYSADLTTKECHKNVNKNGVESE